MGVNEIITSVVWNPVTSAVGTYAYSAALAATIVDQAAKLVQLQPQVEYKMVAPDPLWKLAAQAGPYMRIGALSGAAAVTLGAIGAHKKLSEESKQIYDTANRYHFFHSLAMLALPLCRLPTLAASFMISGTCLFCGTLYYTAFTEDNSYRRFTPMGGTCLILGWLAMCI